jgi:SAM-dependent methyltransferase
VESAVSSRKKYDQGYQRRPFQLRFPGDAIKDSVLAEGVQRALHDKASRMLNVGCGMGHTVALISQRLPDCRVTAVDFSQEALGAAVCRVPAVDFILADAQRLPFRANAFGAAVAQDVTEHLPDDEGFFGEVERVSLPGASICLYVPAVLDGVVFAAEAVVKRLTGYTIDETVGHVRRYSVAQIAHKLERQAIGGDDCLYFSHISMSLLAVLSVWAYHRFIVGKKPASPSGPSRLGAILIYPVLVAFKNAEILGWAEYLLFKRLPGAGLFVFGRTQSLIVRSGAD